MAGLTTTQIAQLNNPQVTSASFGIACPTGDILGMAGAQQTNASGTAPAIDFSTGRRHYVRLTNDCTLSVSVNPVTPGLVKLVFKQAAAGSKTLTLPAAFIGTYVITATADKYDHTTWDWDGTSYVLVSATKGLDA